jgi:hypothetical protein
MLFWCYITQHTSSMPPTYCCTDSTRYMVIPSGNIGY